MITDIILYMFVDLDFFNCNLCYMTLALTFPVQGHFVFLVNLLLSFILMITDIILCLVIDLDQISSTATYLCDPYFDFCPFKVT